LARVPSSGPQTSGVVGRCLSPDITRLRKILHEETSGLEAGGIEKSLEIILAGIAS